MRDDEEFWSMYKSHLQNYYIYVEDCVETLKYHNFIYFRLFTENKISRMSRFENFASINFHELAIWEFFKT